MVLVKRFGAGALALSLFAVSLFISLISVTRVGAAVDTCTWTGTTSANWATGTNWSGCDNGGVPETGDTLVFSSGASNLAMNNNLLIVVAGATFNGSGYSISGNAFESSGTINVFVTTTFTSQVVFSGSSGQKGLNIQGATPTFSGGVNMNVTGTGLVSWFTTSSSLTLPVITGTTPSLFFTGNPTAPLEVYNSNAAAATYTATSVLISRAAFNCTVANCLGANGNVVTVGEGETSAGAALRLNSSGLSLSNPIVVNNFGSGAVGRIESVQGATLTGTLTLTTNGVISTAASAALLVNGATALGSNTLTYEGLSEVVQNGAVSGTGNVVSNVAALTMVNPNTYTGTTTIMPGARINAMSATSLGTTAGNTTIQSGGSLIITPFGGDITIAENIIVSGPGDSPIDGAIHLFDNVDDAFLTGSITLAGDTVFGNGLLGGNLIVNGIIGGSGNLTLNGVGQTATIRLGAVNTFSGNVTVGATTTATAATNAIPDSSAVSLLGSGTLVYATGADDTVSSLSGSGRLFLDGGSVFTANQNSDTTFSGALDSDTAHVDTLLKSGSGALTLTGSCFDTTSPDVRVQAGVLVVNSANMVDCNFIVAGGKLKGNATLGAVTATGGTIAPGSSPGIMNVTSLTLNSGTVFEEEIAGAAVGTGYDRVNATGAVTLGNATLQIVPSYQPTAGTVFTIIQAGSVSGIFNNLADGASVTANGLTFRVNYTGTTVTLTFLSGTLAVTGFDAQTTMLISSMLLVGALFVSLRQRKVATVQV